MGFLDNNEVPESKIVLNTTNVKIANINKVTSFFSKKCVSSSQYLSNW